MWCLGLVVTLMSENNSSSYRMDVSALESRRTSVPGSAFSYRESEARGEEDDF